jgi:hypothetical protein
MEYRVSAKATKTMQEQASPSHELKWQRISNDIVEPFANNLAEMCDQNEHNIVIGQLLACVTFLVNKHGLEFAYEELQSICDDVATAMIDK